MKLYAEPHQVTKGMMVVNPESQDIITVISNSVAGQYMIITGETNAGRIQSFTARTTVQLIAPKFK